MKINVSVEATPEEIRETLGLPNLQDVQSTILEQVSQKLQKDNLDVESLMEILIPKSIQLGKKFMEVALDNMESAANRKQSNADPESD